MTAHELPDKEGARKLHDLITVFTRPHIVMPGYEDMTMPEEIKSQVMIERLAASLRGEQYATNTEAMWYLSTASLTLPLNQHWTNIFTYLVRRHLLAAKKPLPAFLKTPAKLDANEEEELQRLKTWLYSTSHGAMKSADGPAMGALLAQEKPRR